MHQAYQIHVYARALVFNFVLNWINRVYKMLCLALLTIIIIIMGLRRYNNVKLSALNFTLTPRKCWQLIGTCAVFVCFALQILRYVNNNVFIITIYVYLHTQKNSDLWSCSSDSACRLCARLQSWSCLLFFQYKFQASQAKKVNHCQRSRWCVYNHDLKKGRRRRREQNSRLQKIKKDWSFIDRKATPFSV